MAKKLLPQAASKFFGGLLLVGVLLFVPAWSLAFWQAWLFIGILFVPMLFAGAVLLVKKPALLQKRLDAKEEQAEQKSVLLFSDVMFLAAFVVAGLNFRFRWLVLPAWVPVAAAVVFLAAYALYAEVLRENAYLSRTVKVQQDQHVVDTGLYGVVRHPMYMTTLLLFLSMPFVLGSVFSFVILLAYIPLIAKRIRNEEQVLEQGLPGYKEYKTKVKYKVIPFIW